MVLDSGVSLIRQLERGDLGRECEHKLWITLD
jgi:hypothetical protein